MLIMTGKNNKATYKNWCIVINLPNEKSELFNSPNLTIDILKLLIDYYKGCKCYLIYHDKDTKEDGTLKTPHLHCVLLLEKRRSKDNILNDFSTLLKISLNCLSVEDCRSIQGSIRYLIHYEETDKYQYSLEDIKSNDKKYNMYFLDIEEYIATCTSINDFMKVFGVDKAKTYLPLYKQSLSERNETPSELKSQLNIVKNMCYDKDIAINKLTGELKEYKENFDMVKNFVLQYFKNSNSTIYQIISQSDFDFMTYIKNLNKGNKK